SRAEGRAARGRSSDAMASSSARRPSFLPEAEAGRAATAASYTGPRGAEVAAARGAPSRLWRRKALVLPARSPSATLEGRCGRGGGGAARANSTGPGGRPGQDGAISRDPAKGGPGGNDAAGRGGDGGTADGRGNGTLPGRGTSFTSGGGGGGAAGRIRLNARPGKPASVSDSAIVSPAPSVGDIARRWVAVGPRAKCGSRLVPVFAVPPRDDDAFPWTISL